MRRRTLTASLAVPAAAVLLAACGHASPTASRPAATTSTTRHTQTTASRAATTTTAAATADNGFPGQVASQTLSRDDPGAGYTATLKYPQVSGLSSTVQGAINERLRQAASDIVTSFANQVSQSGAGTTTTTAAPGSASASGSAGNYLNGGWSLQRNDKWVVCFELKWSSYTGGAHPVDAAETLNFAVATGVRYGLAGIFGPGSNYLGTLSSISRSMLLAKLGSSDRSFVESGTAPQAANFADWSLTPGGLYLYFPEYQVAPYSEGPQEITIPYSELAGVALAGGPLTAAGGAT